MTPKLVVRYPHRSSDLRPIYLSVGSAGPGGRKWMPAYRDSYNGELVVWVRTNKRASSGVWLMDSRGTREVKTENILSPVME